MASPGQPPKLSTPVSATVTSSTAVTATTPSMVKPTSRISNFITETARKTFFSSDIGLIMFFIGIFFVVGLGIVILFENGVPGMRTQLLSNFIGISLGIGFIVLIFHQMGKTVNIFGHKLDVGMLYYLAILMVVMILFTG